MDEDRIYVELNDINETLVDISNLLSIAIDNQDELFTLILTVSRSGGFFIVPCHYTNTESLMKDIDRIKSIIKKNCGIVTKDFNFAIK